MPQKFENLTGQIFGRLTVKEYAGKNINHREWLCRCECGVTKVIRGASLKTGATKSCGCLFREKSKEWATKTFTKHGQSGYQSRKASPTYNSFRSMRGRCLYPNHVKYPKYGGAGVTICDRWNTANGGSFENFLADLGERPLGTTLGRYGDVGNYEPGNCKWMTPAEQITNRRPDRNCGACKKKIKVVHSVVTALQTSQLNEMQVSI
jgi:hypothetical protein